MGLKEERLEANKKYIEKNKVEVNDIVKTNKGFMQLASQTQVGMQTWSLSGREGVANHFYKLDEVEIVAHIKI